MINIPRLTDDEINKIIKDFGLYGWVNYIKDQNRIIIELLMRLKEKRE
jgi:hypothetical protein